MAIKVDAYEAAINSNPVAQAVIRLMEGLPKWEGSPTDLYAELSGLVDNGHGKKPAGWPTQPQFMSSKLTEAAPALRARHGISFDRGKSGDRSIFLVKEDTTKGTPEEDLGGLDGQDDQIPNFSLRGKQEKEREKAGMASSSSSSSPDDWDAIEF